MFGFSVFDSDLKSVLFGWSSFLYLVRSSCADLWFCNLWIIFQALYEKEASVWNWL